MWEEEKFIKCMACSFIKYVGISAECLGCVHAVGAPLLWGCSFSLFDKEFIHLCSSKKENRKKFMGINWCERNYSLFHLILNKRNKDKELLNPIIIFLGAGGIWGTYGMK